MRCLPLVTVLPLWMIVFASAGCTSKDQSTADPVDTEYDPGDSDDTDSGECQSDDDCSNWQICEDGVCVDGDRNNSVDEAESLLWEDPVTGYINPAEDVDYYTFTAEGGEYIRASTTTEEEEEDSKVEWDTVLVIRDTSGKILAYSDDYPTGSTVGGYDSIVYAYIAEAGEYTISVEDVGSWDGAEGYGSSSYSYELFLEEWSTHTDENDSAESPSYEFAPDSDNTWYAIGVHLEEAGDTDYIKLTYPWDNAGLVIDGIEDLGGSDANPLVRIYDEDGNLLSEKEETGPEGPVFYPAMTAGNYLIEVTDADGNGGDDIWTFLFVYLHSEDSAYDSEAENNDDPTFANEIELTDLENSSGNKFSRGYKQGFVDTSDDEDWLSFEAPADYEEAYVVACMNSSIWGSTAAPTIELYDSSGTLLLDENDEDASVAGDPDSKPNANIENAPATPGDTHYLRVVAPEDAEGSASEWWRINIYVASFAVSSYEEGGYACP